ncbi:MAG TPA: MFS transporter [Methanospirillum sp.]|nr:MFS transporter [Methanospirillum sp.]
MNPGTLLEEPITTCFQQRLIVLVITLRMILGAVDGAMLPIAISTIVWDIGSAYAPLLLIVDSIIFVSTFVICGRIGDYVGLKRMFVTGTAIFTISSFLYVGADSMPMLIACRLIQTIGLTMSVPVSIPLILAWVPLERQARSIGYQFMGRSVGIAVSPLIAGLVLQYLGWRELFLILVPLGLFIVIIGYKAIPKDIIRKGTRNYDFPAAILLLLTLGSFGIGMNLGLLARNIPLFAVAMAISIPAGILLWFHERRTTDPLIDFRFITRKTIAIPLILTFAIFLVWRGAIYFIPIYLNEILLVQPITTGLMISIAAVITAVGGPLAGYYIERKGMAGIRLLFSLSGISGIIACVAMIVSGIPGQWVIIFVLVMLGILYTCGTPVFVYYFRSVPKGESGLAGGIIDTGTELAKLAAIMLTQILFAGGILVSSGGFISVKEISTSVAPAVQAIFLFLLLVSLAIFVIGRSAPDPVEGCSIDRSQ